MMTVVWWGAVSVVLYGGCCKLILIAVYVSVHYGGCCELCVVWWGSVSLYLSPFMFQCTMGDAVSFVLYGGVL